jgi:hypothetical protein
MKIVESIPTDAKEYEPPKVEEIRDFLGSRVVSQDKAIERVSRELVHALSGLKTNPHGPRGSILMLGPSGVGKTETVLTALDLLLQHSNIPPEDRDPEKFLIKIDCGEYTESHHAARVMGSPAGYVGSKGTSNYVPPALGAENLDAHTFELQGGEKISVVLLDEIEKAHPSLRNYLLAALDKGIAQTAANEEVSFRNTIFFFTSNLGSHVLAQMRPQGESLGFASGAGEDESARTKQATTVIHRALKEFFRPEDISRMSGSAEEAIIFETLDRSASEKILGIQLEQAEGEFFKQGIRLEFQMTAQAKDKLLDLGVNQETGARALKVVIKNQIIQPLLHASKQENVNALNGRVVYIGYSGTSFSFYTAEALDKVPAVSKRDSEKSKDPKKGEEEQEAESSDAVESPELAEIEELFISADAQQKMKELGVTFDKNTLNIRLAHSDIVSSFSFGGYAKQNKFTRLTVFVPQHQSENVVIVRFSHPTWEIDFGIDKNGLPSRVSFILEEHTTGEKPNYSWQPIRSVTK